MSDDTSGSKKSGEATGDDLHGGSDGHASDIPDESPASESEVALSQKVADREADGDDA